MKDSARYVKRVEWSDEDRCFVGSCPGVIGPCCHGDDEVAVYPGAVRDRGRVAGGHSRRGGDAARTEGEPAVWHTPGRSYGTGRIVVPEALLRGAGPAQPCAMRPRRP